MSTPISCESFNREYQLCEKIGRGQFGVVHRCISSSSGESFAVKTINKLEDPNCSDKLLLDLPPHPNILRIHNLYESDTQLLIVTDLCDSPDLYDRLDSSGRLPEAEARSILSQLVSALSHCHLHGVAHRDIKPENVLFDSKGNLKLSDFGLAQRFTRGVPMRGGAGTHYYLSPEMLVGEEGYDEKVDVWGAGVLLYKMLSGEVPFSGETTKDMVRAIIRDEALLPNRYFGSVSAEAKDLIWKMLCKDRRRRLTAEQVLRHPWVVGRRKTSTSTSTWIPISGTHAARYISELRRSSF